VGSPATDPIREISLVKTPSRLRSPTLLVIARSGLANRLRAVLSSRAIASGLGIDFQVYWGKSDGFSDDRWEDLFATRIPQISQQECEDFLSSIDPVELVPGILFPGRTLLPVSRRGLLRSIRRRGLIFQDGAFNLISLLKEAGLKIPRPTRKHFKELCESLRPVDPIRRRIDSFTQAHYQGRRVTGIHIRRGDALQGGDAEFYLESPDEAFHRAIERELSDHSETYFYLSTDCFETRKRFSESYRERMLGFEKDFVESTVGEPKLGQIDAAIEIFLLSRCNEVIGTNWSSFGRVAALIGGIPFRRALLNQGEQ